MTRLLVLKVFEEFFYTSSPWQAAGVALQGFKLCRLLFSLGSRATYYETTDIRNMGFNKLSNEKFNKYTELELKQGHDKFPPA